MATLKMHACFSMASRTAIVRAPSRVAGSRPVTVKPPSGIRQRAVHAHSIPVSGPTSGVEASGAPAGQITSQLMLDMRAKIGEALETEQVTVQDVYGDGRHVSIDVVSKLFEGKNAVQRQRMVYKAIWLELQEAVHAVDAMTTKTPEEASN